MKKLDNIEKYITDCDEKILSNEKEQEEFIEEVVSVYSNEIEGMTNRLDMYGYYNEGMECDYNGDIKKIRAILINHRDNLEMETEKRKDELEIARLRQGDINISANVNNSNEINISFTLEQTIENIHQIPDNILSEEDKEVIGDKLCGINEAIKKDKEKAKDKVMSVLKFVVDKGADALIAVLPYLGQIAGIL